MTKEAIYNQWLVSSRANLDKPFKIKKDFKGFEQEDYYPFLVKIEYVLTRNSNIDLREFFDAPYKVWPNDKRPYQIEYYSTRKAINAYLLYKKILEKQKNDTKSIQEGDNSFENKK